MNQKRSLVFTFVIILLSSFTILTPNQQLIPNEKDHFVLDRLESVDTPVVQTEESFSDSLPTSSVPIPTEPEAISGIIDPIQVEQRGYSTTGDLSARTDTSANTQGSLDIDIAHDWVASTASIDVWNLEKLYVVNGTFDEGPLGYTVSPNGTLEFYPLSWSAISTSTNLDQVQRVSYEDIGERYITVQNQAKVTNNPQHEYTHYAGTTVLWNQTFDISPYTDEFLLSFNYLYLQGPLTPIFNGDFSLQVFIDGDSVYSIDLPTLSSRGTWFDTGLISINKTILADSTMFMIGLVIDSTFLVDGDIDYDSDGTPDGIINTQYITVYLDDVSLISATPPNCDDVNLEFSIDGVVAPIIGYLGSGTGLLQNSSYWISDVLDIAILSNTSISLDYNVHILNHRFLNSSSTTNILSEGIAYAVDTYSSANLEIFTYLGFLGVYENLTLKIFHPIDWQNFTIQDPFLTNVTSQCISYSDYVEIPTELLDRLGWWKITCQAPNYASESETQKYDVDTTNWASDTIFHTGDRIRLSANINSGIDFPSLSDPVTFTWGLPNCTIWYESYVTSGTAGSVISTSTSFGATNATAGQWCISYFWTNGTEVAYGFSEFFLHHQASVEIVFEEELNTVVGQPVTVVVRFYDIENGLLILNDGAAVSGTWAGGTVDFDANLVKNWWEADFDTSLVGAGNFNVTITSSAPFFETSPLIVTIESQYLTHLEAPSGPLEPLIYSRSYTFEFFYSRSYDALGIAGATVDIIDEGSQWASITDSGDGHYNLTLVPLGLRDYTIRMTFSKIGYQNQTFILSFLVEEVPIEVRLVPPSTLSGPEFESVPVEIEIVEVDTEIPVVGANVTLSIRTSGGDYYVIQAMDEIGDGHYTTSFLMPTASSITYSLSIQVAKENYELNQEFRDTLVPLVDPDARILQTVIQYSWQIAFGASIMVAAVGIQRVFARRSRRKRAIARAIELRFIDAENLLGLLVLHKVSGVPVFSKILKGGFEEGMLSAFISAIMHFRSEFETVDMDDEYKILPISDIIRAVPTPNLICAFITISSPSPEQEQKMIGYTRAVGMMLDDSLKSRPVQVVDAKTAKTFEWLFDDFVDGGLLRRYQIGEKELPRKFKPLKGVIPTISTNGMFKLHELVRALEESGMSEENAYILVMDAVDNEFLVPIYSFNDKSDTDSLES